VVLTGMALDSCVLATAMDANSREYQTIIAHEAVAALPDRREPALQTLQRSSTAELMSNAALEIMLGSLADNSA